MARRLIVALETSTGCGSVSLTSGSLQDGRLLAEATCRPELTHSRQLLSSVQWIFKQSGTDWGDVAAVAVSLGPGSFTGLRIGLAAAKGMAMAADLQLVGVASLDALALHCPASGTPLLMVSDARKQEVYAAWYHPDDRGVPRRSAALRAMPPKRLLEEITEPTLVAGSGVSVYAELFAAHPLVRVLPAPLFDPRAALVGLLGGEKLAAGQVLDPAGAAPLYIRASEAEINYDLKRRQREVNR